MKRTAQINSLIEENGIELFDFDSVSCPKTYINKISYLFIGLMLLIKNKRFKFSFSFIKEGKHIGYAFYSLEQKLIELESDFDISSFIWEFTWPKNWFIPLLVKKLGKKTIALPHNLESLVYSQKSYKSPKLESPSWFQEEMQYLSWCDSIFTISREEQWLLSLFFKNKKINYLPYYPPKNTFRNLLSIKKRRAKERTSNHIVVLGSAVNPPTLEGFFHLVKYIKKEKLNNYHFDFVGFGMSSLKIKIDDIPANIDFFDGLSNEDLEYKLIDAKCVLIYQIPSTGALTKIIELQIAGIPILANSSAARNYYNSKGLVIFENISELENKINEISNFKIEDIPLTNGIYEEEFINSI